MTALARYDPSKRKKTKRAGRTLYLHQAFADDTGGVISHLWNDTKTILKGEGLRYDPRHLKEDQEAPELGPDDLYIRFEVLSYKPASDSMRVLRAVKGPFGWGASKLKLGVHIGYGPEEEESYEIKASHGGTVLDGSAKDLMRTAAYKAAVRTARLITKRLKGRTTINHYGRRALLRSKSFGWLGLVPFMGVFFAPVALLFGLVGTAIVLKRGLNLKKRVMGVLFLALVGCAINGFILYKIFYQPLYSSVPYY